MQVAQPFVWIGGASSQATAWVNLVAACCRLDVIRARPTTILCDSTVLSTGRLSAFNAYRAIGFTVVSLAETLASQTTGAHSLMREIPFTELTRLATFRA